MAEENEQEVYRPYVAELADKRGYIHPIHAKQLAEERTVTMTGDVTGSANWDFGEPATTGQSSESMALTIGNKKVTTDKIDDKAVGSGQMADHSVGLTQIDTNAITSTATSTGADKDKLITSEGVRNAIDNAIEGRGIDYGPLTVDQINALTDIPTGSTAHIIAGGTATVITDGDLPVRVGEDVKYHISGNSHGWYSLDGEFKLKQTAKTDPTASGTTITAIDSITQNENGEITATKKTIRTGNASDTGVVKLSDSHTSDSSTNGGVAATPAAVKSAYDLAAGKKDKQTPLDTDTGSGSGKGGTTKTLTRLVQDADGAITPTFSNIADASGSSKGLMSSADYTKLAGIAAGAEVNQNSFSNVKVGNVTIEADSKTDTLEIAGGTGIDATGDAANDKVTLSLDSATQTSLGKADSAVQSVKINGSSELKDASGNVNIPLAVATGSTGAKAGALSADDKKKLNDLGTAAFKNVPASGNASSTEVVLGSDTRLSAGASAVQDVTVGGTSVVNASTKVAAIPDASTSAKGAVQLAGSIGATVASENNKAATEKAVRDAINALDAEVTSNDGTNVQVKVTEADGKVSAVNITTDNTENRNNKVTSVRAASSATDTAYPSEKAVATALADKVDVPPSASVYGFKFVKGLSTVIYNGHGFEFTEFYGGSSKNYMVGFRLPAATAETPMASGTMITIVAEKNADYNPGLTFKYKVSGSNLEVYALFSVANRVIYDVTTVLKGYDFTVLTSEPDTSGLTDFPDANLRWRRTPLIPSSSGGVGSSSVPVYIDDNNLVKACTDDFEHTTNKVSSWQSTPDNTHYPSEKLVKDSLDAKADANKVVAIADAMIKRVGQTGSGWYKLAELSNTSTYDNVNCCFDVYAATDTKKLAGRLEVAIRTGNSAGASLAVVLKKFYSDAWLSDYKFKIVIRGLTASATIELWASCLRDFGGLVISERNTSSYTANNKKDRWTYTSYENNGGSAAPVTDATNNVKVEDVDVVYRQLAIASPTNNNIVAMDANGLVKDSGLTKSSVESAITSAGSAIQGVKVNSTSLTPDANKVVNIPLATTSTDGAMSAADKTKLDGIEEGAEVNVQADWNATGGDAFIPNKPIYRRYVDSATNIFKVCTVKANSGVETSGFRFIVRYTDGAILGDFVFRNGAKLFYNAANITTSTGQKVVFYKITNASNANVIDLYAYANAYTELRIDAVVNANGNLKIDFSGFGVSVSALPEGATEITPVWVANASASSGTAPVKVDAYGALTAVPMDSTPTVSSTNLMTSGAIKTALDAKDFLYVNYRVAKDADTLPVQNHFSVDELNSTSTNTPISGIFFHVYTVKGHDDGSVTQIAVGVNDNAQSVYIRRKQSGTWTSWISLRDAKYSEKIGTSSSHPAIGSNSVPVHVDSSGSIVACTDDFVHDGDVAQTYSSSSSAPISGAGVSAALATSLTDVEFVAAQSGGGGNLNKTKNGTTTSVLAFMTDAEAIDLWRTAWDEAD